MRAKERQAWLSRNVGKGGQRPSVDPFNKAKKGGERYPTAEEYASKNVEEYHDYSENKDLTKEDERKKDDSQRSDRSDKSRGSGTRQAGVSRARSIIGRVVGCVVGAVVVVTGYQAIQEHEAAKAAPAVFVEWQWGDDFSSVTAEVKDDKGKLVKEVAGAQVIVTVTEIEATCTEAGLKTYTATFTDEDGKEYSDTKTEPIEPTGHDLSEVGVETSGNQVTTTFECTHCHEQFTTTISVEEEE